MDRNESKGGHTRRLIAVLRDADKVTVCDHCLRASCWQGEFMCDYAQSAGTVEKTVAELRSDPHGEHEEYWTKDASLSAELLLRMTGQAQGLRPIILSGWPRPWRYEAEGYNEGPCIKDKNGQVICIMLWPIHHPDATKMVEAQMDYLGLLWSSAVEAQEALRRHGDAASAGTGKRDALTAAAQTLVDRDEMEIGAFVDKYPDYPLGDILGAMRWHTEKCRAAIAKAGGRS